MDIGQAAAGIDLYITTLCKTINALDKVQLAQMAKIVLEAQARGKAVYTMGNGGHGNTAAHMINDLAKHTISSDNKESVATGKRFRTMCLNDSVSFLTGLANDMGYEHVFSEQLKNWCQEGDVVMAFTHSRWWKNLDGGAPVTLHIRGKTKQGMAEPTVDDKEAIATALTKHLKNNKMDAKYYQVTYDDNGDPNAEKIRKAAEVAVMIRVVLN